jgi:hypothetical protein
MEVEEFAAKVLLQRYKKGTKFNELMELAGDDEVKRDVVDRVFGVPYWTTEWRIKEAVDNFAEEMYNKCLLPYTEEDFDYNGEQGDNHGI